MPEPVTMSARSMNFRRTYRPVVLWTAVVLSLAVSGIARAEATVPAAPKTLTFITPWLPQAQFAGYYAALEKGIYKKYGLDVTILHGGPNRSPYDFLVRQEADVASLWLASAIEKRVQGGRLVHIGQIVQKSALMLIAKKSSGIRTPKDMEGKKVGLWDEIYQVQPKAFFEKNGIQVTIIPQSYSVSLFLRGGVDVSSAMWYNEYHTILNAGYDPDELTAFFFQDYGLSFPEDGLYVLEEKLAEDPARYAAFVKASMEGWQYAFEHPEEILEIVLRYMREAHVPANDVHQKWMLERMKDVVLPEDKGRLPGSLAEDDYLRTAGVLKESGLIDEIPPMAEFCKFEGGTREV
ncbi:MAG: ABC transporter substrate-binding protein [Candidatus Omnitrophica bacterium]|nr:ABC transporter substrate-binding protein [Candidatus Omnitrophota bacterium]MDD5671964.1 ABC transporter substrate-binding protein [Candidatus Omnitrophota bacterium]